MFCICMTFVQEDFRTFVGQINLKFCFHSLKDCPGIVFFYAYDTDVVTTVTIK